jgi:hypothetical protein
MLMLAKPWQFDVTLCHFIQEGGTVSHIVTIQTKVHDPGAVTAACQRLNLPTPTQGTVELFSGQAEGLIIRLPAWEYPLAIDTLSGTLRYDNYGGAWGSQSELDRFPQFYAVEKAKIEARKKGYSVSEQSLVDGSIKVQIIEAA